MSLYPFVIAVFVEAGRCELAATNRTQHSQLVVVLQLCSSLVLYDGLLRLVLGGEEVSSTCTCCSHQ